MVDHDEGDGRVTRLDTIVAGGSLVAPEGVRRADLGIADGRIAAVGDLADAAAGERIDADGLLVLPGAIDEHVHPIYHDDPGATSVAAVHGGITSALHFAYAKPGESLVTSVAALREQSERTSLIDFGIHAGMFDPGAQAAEMAAVAATGVRTFKVFLAYGAQGWMTDDAALIDVLRRSAALGGLVLVHCENGLAIDALEADAKAGRLGADPVDAFLATRPAALEAEATHRVAALAEVFDADVFIVHVTNKRSLEVVRGARSRGQRIAAETCPHYLTLTGEELRTRGALAKVGPPLRTADDHEALWAGLADGTLQGVGSDHAPKKHRDDPPEPLMTAGFGAPAIETLTAIVFDGVATGRLSLERFAAVTAANPAKVFGLYPRKGSLEVGADADVVLWDPAVRRVLGAATEHSRAAYSLYEGRAVQGAPVRTIVGGRTVVAAGELVDATPRGAFLPTGPFDLLPGDGAAAAAAVAVGG
jgi:dihydropyrimidinase